MQKRITLFLASLSLLLMTALAHGQSEAIQISLDQFGVGRTFRPGEFTGIRLQITSTGVEAIPVWVQAEVANADGDVGEFGRELTLSPGVPRKVWLYVPLPVDFDPSSVIPVRVFEVRDGRRRGELGGMRISPGDIGANAVDVSSSLIAVVGESGASMRLNDYSNRGPRGRPPFAHEDTRVVFGLRTEDLPDKWEGWRAFEAVAWGRGSSTAPARPGDLGDGEIRALRHYVQRGGHLIISLPPLLNPWGLGVPGQCRLEDLLPPGEPTRQEEVPVSTLLPVLTKARQLRGDVSVTLHVFKQIGVKADRSIPNAIADSPYRPLITLPDGRVIVVQRSYGFGHVTVIGLDLADQTMMSMGGVVQADVFWNRILGRRIDTPSGDDLQEMSERKRLATSTTPENNLGGGALFSQLISMTQVASQGLLAVLVLFAVYWVAAGPGGFYLLKQYKMEKHAWVAFAAAAGVFTAAAWGMVALIKPGDYTIRHITVLDMLELPGQTDPSAPPLTRASAWFSLNMPGYRRTSVFIDSAKGQRDLLASWTPPEIPGQPFPNPDRYRVDVGGAPASYGHYVFRNDGRPEFQRPSRATATQLYANWMGHLSPDWGGTIHNAVGSPVELRKEAGGNEQLVGAIQHDLPGELTDIQIILVQNNRRLPRRYTYSGTTVLPFIASSGQMLNSGQMWRLGEAFRWAASSPLDLQVVTDQTSRLEAAIEGRYTARYARTTLGLNPSAKVDKGDWVPYLEMLGLFNQLQPPEYVTDAQGKRPDTVAFYRLLGRELDLSTWLNGPCLIVTGFLDRGTATPIPIIVNDGPPETDPGSMVMVRWVCPLPIREEDAFFESFE